MNTAIVFFIIGKDLKRTCNKAHKGDRCSSIVFFLVINTSSDTEGLKKKKIKVLIS